MAGKQQGINGRGDSRRAGLLQAQGRAARCPSVSPTVGSPVDPAVSRLLRCRYGDGLIYLHDTTQRPVFELAMSLGLVSADGYLTAAGAAAASTATDFD